MSRASGLNSSLGTCGYPGSLKDESNWRPRTHTCLPSMRLHLIQTNPPTDAHPRGLEHARQSMQQLFSLLPRTFVGVYVGLSECASVFAFRWCLSFGSKRILMAEQLLNLGGDKQQMAGAPKKIEGRTTSIYGGTTQWMLMLAHNAIKCPCLGHHPHPIHPPQTDTTIEGGMFNPPTHEKEITLKFAPNVTCEKEFCLCECKSSLKRIRQHLSLCATFAYVLLYNKYIYFCVYTHSSHCHHKPAHIFIWFRCLWHVTANLQLN